MEIRELSCFIQIARDKSYTKAANNLFLSQPALSRTIMKLEHELDAKLFQKVKTGLELTDCGKALMDSALPVVNQFQRLPGIVSDVKQLKVGALRVGVTPLLSAMFMAQAVMDYCMKWPGIELTLYEAGTQDVCDQLLRGDIELGVCLLPAIQANFEIHVVLEDEWVLFTHRDNPLSRCDVVQMEQLKDQEFNTFNMGASITDELFGRCKRAGFIPNINLSSARAHYLINMTSQGRGVCFLPRPYAEKFVPSDLKMTSLNPKIPWVCCIVTRKNDYLPHAARAFYQTLTHTFRQYISQKQAQPIHSDAKREAR